MNWERMYEILPTLYACTDTVQRVYFNLLAWKFVYCVAPLYLISVNHVVLN
jgi:hypothetical protein